MREWSFFILGETLNEYLVIIFYGKKIDPEVLIFAVLEVYCHYRLKIYHFYR